MKTKAASFMRRYLEKPCICDHCGKEFLHRAGKRAICPHCASRALSPKRKV
jgi:DNA-directed RNA polymerase subunit RPC12/RpoP